MPLRRALPKECLIDLIGAQKKLKLFQARKGAVFKDVLGETYLLEKVVKLSDTFVRIPGTFELRQVLADLVEVYAITPIIGALRTKGELTFWKDGRHFLSYFLNLIV